MDEPFELKASHLVPICDAVLVGQLDAAVLETVGFCIIASDCFRLAEDLDDRLSFALHHWSSPDINYPLTLPNVRKWKELLETGRNAFE